LGHGWLQARSNAQARARASAELGAVCRTESARSESERGMQGRQGVIAQCASCAATARISKEGRARAELTRPAGGGCCGCCSVATGSAATELSGNRAPWQQAQQQQGSAATGPSGYRTQRLQSSVAIKLSGNNSAATTLSGNSSAAAITTSARQGERGARRNLPDRKCALEQQARRAGAAGRCSAVFAFYRRPQGAQGSSSAATRLCLCPAAVLSL
jgi:hypothetical protein